MRSFTKWYVECSEFSHSCEEGRIANYRSVRELGNSVINLLRDREDEACSGDGQYYELSAGEKTGAYKDISLLLKLACFQLAAFDIDKN